MVHAIMPRDMIPVTAKIPTQSVKNLGRLRVSCLVRGVSLSGILWSRLLVKPGLAGELLDLEKQKKERLIRYIM